MKSDDMIVGKIYLDIAHSELTFSYASKILFTIPVTSVETYMHGHSSGISSELTIKQLRELTCRLSKIERNKFIP